jgi:hypothetical protein
MKYYIIDNQGNTYGESNDKANAEILMDEYKKLLADEGKTAEEIEALDLEIIEGA